MTTEFHDPRCPRTSRCRLGVVGLRARLKPERSWFESRRWHRSMARRSPGGDGSPTNCRRRVRFPDSLRLVSTAVVRSLDKRRTGVRVLHEARSMGRHVPRGRAALAMRLRSVRFRSCPRRKARSARCRHRSRKPGGARASGFDSYTFHALEDGLAVARAPSATRSGPSPDRGSTPPSSTLSFQRSKMALHSAVNRGGAGSTPAAGAVRLWCAWCSGSHARP